MNSPPQRVWAEAQGFNIVLRYLWNCVCLCLCYPSKSVVCVSAVCLFAFLSVCLLCLCLFLCLCVCLSLVIWVCICVCLWCWLLMTPFDSLGPSLQHISSLGRFIHFWAGEVDGCLQRFALMRSTCKFCDEFLKVPLISTAFLHGAATLRAWGAPDI